MKKPILTHLRKSRLVGEGEILQEAVGKNCSVFCSKGIGSTRKFCPPNATSCQRLPSVRRFYATVMYQLLLVRLVKLGSGKKPANIACTRTGEIGLF